jgi:hypothetical protein
MEAAIKALFDHLHKETGRSFLVLIGGTSAGASITAGS